MTTLNFTMQQIESLESLRELSSAGFTVMIVPSVKTKGGPKLGSSMSRWTSAEIAILHKTFSSKLVSAHGELECARQSVKHLPNRSVQAIIAKYRNSSVKGDIARSK